MNRWLLQDSDLPSDATRAVMVTDNLCTFWTPLQDGETLDDVVREYVRTLDPDAIPDGESFWPEDTWRAAIIRRDDGDWSTWADGRKEDYFTFRAASYLEIRNQEVTR